MAALMGHVDGAGSVVTVVADGGGRMVVSRVRCRRVQKEMRPRGETAARGRFGFKKVFHLCGLRLLPVGVKVRGSPSTPTHELCWGRPWRRCRGCYDK